MNQNSYLLLPGMQIGDYSIVQKIGNGGFGTVYKVESNIDSQQYALKILKNTSSSAFRKEIEIATMLNNKFNSNTPKSSYFAQVHDIGETDNFTYYVSELLGPSLEFMTYKQEEGSLSQLTNFHKKSLQYAKEMLLCLKKLHSIHIIHCDVKPANFLIRNEMDEISLIDFGLSKIVRNFKADQKVNMQNFKDFFEKIFQFKINDLSQKVDLSNKIKRTKSEVKFNKNILNSNHNEVNQSKKKLFLFRFTNNFAHKDKNTFQQYINSENKCKKKNKPHFKGTYKYASYNALNGGITGPRDDLISWFYSILEIYSGSSILPWDPLAQEIMANQNYVHLDTNISFNSELNSDITESPIVEMKKMKKYFEGITSSTQAEKFILPEQLCEIINMPFEMVEAFRRILALEQGEVFYSDSSYDEIIFYVDSAINSLEKQNESI